MKPIINELMDKYDLSAVRISEEIGKWSYKGSYATLRRYCRTTKSEKVNKGFIPP